MDNWNGVGSLLIACLELILLINLLIFSEKNRFNNTAMTMLFILLIYQSFEFLICQAGLNSSFMVYLAFADISFLPPLNLILLFRLFDRKSKLLNLALLPPIGFAIYYAVIIEQFHVTSCAVLYASYNYPLGELYGAFYYLPIVISMIWLIKTIRSNSEKREKFIPKILLTGNLIISIPVIIGFVLMISGNYYLISKIESIMCKFAFFYAVCLGIVCLYNSKKPYGRKNT